MNCSYDELKEMAQEEFDYWYYKIGVNEEGIYGAIIEDAANYNKVSIAEKLCEVTFLLAICIEKELFSINMLIEMNEIIKNKEEIQQELGEDYGRLLEEIDVIMDKYWKLAESKSLHELLALYRREK